MIITFDLDSVIFDLNPLMAMAFDGAGRPYTYPTNWNPYECYSHQIASRMMQLFADDALYNMPLIDDKVPEMLNNLMTRHGTQVLFVTQRVLKQPVKTFKQLQNAGIHCELAQVYDKHGDKVDVLSGIHPDVHFDDSPLVVSGCLERNIPIVMISNNTTPYNHHLRNRVKHYENLRTAMVAQGLFNSHQYK